MQNQPHKSLYDSLSGRADMNRGAEANRPPVPQNMAGMTMQDAMAQLRANPAEILRQSGFQVPAEAIGNPRDTVMHLIQSGQVGGPMMRMIQPMLARMGVK